MTSVCLAGMVKGLPLAPKLGSSPETKQQPGNRRSGAETQGGHHSLASRPLRARSADAVMSDVSRAETPATAEAGVASSRVVAGCGGIGVKRPRSACDLGGRGDDESSLREDELSPQEYLHKILLERGYEVELMPAVQQAFFKPPTQKQVADYDLALVTAVKRGDLEMVRHLATMGRAMDACNKHGESIVHISCRRGHTDLLRFLLENGGRVETCDDLGRTPLHDACWAKMPVFECVRMILERNLGLLRVVDCRGASPLAYIKREHWASWRHFFDSKKDEYWAPRSPSSSAGSSTSSSCASTSTVCTGNEEQCGGHRTSKLARHDDGPTMAPPACRGKGEAVYQQQHIGCLSAGADRMSGSSLSPASPPTSSSSSPGRPVRHPPMR